MKVSRNILYYREETLQKNVWSEATYVSTLAVVGIRRCTEVGNIFVACCRVGFICGPLS